MLRQEDFEFQDSFGYRVKYLEQNKTKQKQINLHVQVGAITEDLTFTANNCLVLTMSSARVNKMSQTSHLIG